MENFSRRLKKFSSLQEG